MTSAITNAVLAQALDQLQQQARQTRSQLELAQARAEALHAALEQAVAHVKRSGWMSTEDQAQLRTWQALLAEGRR